MRAGQMVKLSASARGVALMAAQGSTETFNGGQQAHPDGRKPASKLIVKASKVGPEYSQS